MDDALDQLHPMPGLTGQQFFMLQVLLVQGRMGEVPLVPGTVLFSHFQGMEDISVPGTSILSGSGVIRSE